MIQEINGLLDAYHVWLKQKTSLQQVEECVVITTPYLDRHNDCIQIYACPEQGGYLLTDDGYTIRDLEMSGCRLDSPRRRALLEMTLRGFGVQLAGDAIQVHAAAGNFPLRKHSLVQAMLAVNDLFSLASATVTSVFLEDVTAWLDLHEIRYTPGLKFTGRTGFDYHFDFVIPRSRNQPERLIRAINQPERQVAQAAVLAWLDTRDVRPPESRLYVVLNDDAGAVRPSVIDALRSYDVRSIAWSAREDAWPELAA